MWCAMPGIMGTRTESPMAKAPTRVSVTYAAGVGAQNTSGANCSHVPTSAAPHRPQKSSLGQKAAAAHAASSTPLTRSFQAMTDWE